MAINTLPVGRKPIEPTVPAPTSTEAATTEPTEAWDRLQDYAARVDESGLATVRLVAPFIPTIPGTDTYTDQLW